MINEKIFCIGLSKTGTTSFGKCMHQLGFNHKTYDLELLRDAKKGIYDEIYNTVDRYESFDDWPWPLIYKEIDKKYTNSKFVLTVRKEPEVWYQSLKKHSIRIDTSDYEKLVYGHAIPHGHKKKYIDFYNRHNEEVMDYFSGTDKLLVVCWEDKADWEELCGYLGRPIPSIPFPHVNKGTSPNTLRMKVKYVIRFIIRYLVQR